MSRVEKDVPSSTSSMRRSARFPVDIHAGKAAHNTADMMTTVKGTRMLGLP
jgi:hypothetical protein